MGIDSKRAPPLPAPTETDSPTATELTTDVSKPADEKSYYSLPEDGTPVTIKTRHKPNRSQTSLLIEYFEGSQQAGASGSGSDRKPSVRVRLTPSRKGKNDRIQITESKDAGGRKASLHRRTPLTPGATPKAQAHAEPVEGEDGNSISSYASATEESNVSRNQPIEVGIDLGRAGRRRRPASPLIPASDTMPPYQAGTQSEISAIPTDSFLDGSGPTRTPDGKRIVSPPSDKIKSSKTRTGSRERVKIADKAKEKDRKQRASKSRNSSLSEKRDRDRDRVDSPRRRSSRSHQESVLSGGDSSVVSSNLSPSHRSYDTNSIRSGSSKSINNPKLLETVEDAIRRLILPELSALKREQSKRESSRRGSLTSTGTSLSREDIHSDRRRSSGKGRETRYKEGYKEGRDRDSRYDYGTISPRSHDQDSIDGSSIRDAVSTPKRSSDRLKTTAAVGAAGALGGLAAAAVRDSPSDKKERRRRRAETFRSQSRASDTYTDDYDDELSIPAPPMPLMSEVNPSEVTRASILSADTDRPHSATEELTPVREVPRGVTSLGSTPTPTKTPVSLQQSLGTQHANISHGDLTVLRNKRDDDVIKPEADQYSRDISLPSRREGEMDDDDGPDEPQEDVAPSSSYDYYNTQDLPAHLNYEPYLPERRGLSPIYSVSGYTEGGSEAAQQRDSRATYTTSSDSQEKSPLPNASTHSPSSVPSNIMSREFDQQSEHNSEHSDDRSMQSSRAGYRNTTYTDDSELERVTSGQAIRGVGANPDIVHVPVGVESHVASLIDGSMVDQSVLSAGDYSGQRDSVVSYDDQSRAYSGGGVGQRDVSPVSSRNRDYDHEEREGTPVSRRHQPSREFNDEYDLDDHGRKVPQTNTYRHSPTESETAIIAQSAAERAIKDLKARQGKQATVEDEDDGWVGAGVGRNKSFKERTLEGREPANTPAHSIDRLEYDDQPKMMASGLPDFNDPMPEIGYVDDTHTHTEPSVINEDGDRGHEDEDEDDWEGRATPKPIARERPRHVAESRGFGMPDAATAAGLGAGAAAAAAAAAYANHSRQPSQEQEEDWQRTSEERKRDTLGTNPFDGMSPVANPPENLFAAGNYEVPGLGFHTGSPGVALEDEGYKSGVQNRTPDFQARQKGFGGDGDMDDPFYDAPKGQTGQVSHTRHLSGLSHGMATPLYDAATGGGIDRIESKDIIALMQDLVARDAQRTARDVEIAETVMFLAREMRLSFKTVDTSFRTVEDRIKKAEGVIVDEIEESEKALTKAIGGPRPYPGSGGRSMQGSQAGDDASGKKNGNKIMRALKGLRTSGTNDLTRIEDMLLTLLKEVDELKVQSGRGNGTSVRAQSFDNMEPEPQYDQDHGYEPEGRAGTASQASQSGHLSVPRSGGPSRRYSENRISTVPEASEEGQDGHDVGRRPSAAPYSDPNLLTPGHGGGYQRGSSVPLDTPPQPAAPAQASLSNENTPKTEKKKHKSIGSSSWLPKFAQKSRWSETTTSSVGKAFRSSGISRKDRESEYIQHPPSRSGSDLADYNETYTHDPYGQDKLHSGFSEHDLPTTSQPLETMPPLPATYMTPEDPKYKVHRNSLNLQHPQPRPGQTEKFKMALESQAHTFDSPTSPRSAEWAGSATSLHRFPHQSTNRYSDGSAVAGAGGDTGEYWNTSPGPNSGPPRPPKEPLDGRRGATTPAKAAANRISKLQKGSPLPHHSVESGYGTATATHTHYTGSPKLENRNLSGALGVPTRRPSGPRAMTPKSAEEDAAREERRRKRDTFGTIASQDTDTF